MEDTFKAEGLHVLGFLSNDFANQGGTPGQIDMCNGQYGVTFEQFAIAHVTDPDGPGPQTAQPVWDWLISQPNPGPWGTPQPLWNFHKYLIARDGTLMAHWDSAVYPGDDPNNPGDSFDTSAVVVAIKAELAKPKP